MRERWGARAGAARGSGCARLGLARAHAPPRGERGGRRRGAGRRRGGRGAARRARRSPECACARAGERVSAAAAARPARRRRGEGRREPNLGWGAAGGPGATGMHLQRRFSLQRAGGPSLGGADTETSHHGQLRLSPAPGMGPRVAVVSPRAGRWGRQERSGAAAAASASPGPGAWLWGWGGPGRPRRRLLSASPGWMRGRLPVFLPPFLSPSPPHPRAACLNPGPVIRGARGQSAAVERKKEPISRTCH